MTTARVVRAPIADLAPGERQLSDEMTRYLCRVRRLGMGDSFVAFDPIAHVEADATLTGGLGPDGRANATIGPTRAAIVVAQEALVLVYALAKGDKIDAVVRDATELGATRIVLAKTERAIVKVTSSGSSDQKIARWERIAREAARQCGRADPPRIDGVHGWRDALVRGAEGCEARFCLDPRALVPLGSALVDSVARRDALAFAVGPEGGLSADEIEIAVGLGYLPSCLGPFTLRTETVAAAVLGAVRILMAER
jgi:16S rRNA (uracil1498-N3)-methyltransferase